MQLLHRLVELSGDRLGQHVERAGDAVEDRVLVLRGGLAEHPRRDLVLVARMTDADAQAVELAMPEMLDGVAKPVLAAVAAIELHPHRSEERRVGKECRSRGAPYH